MTSSSPEAADLEPNPTSPSGPNPKSWGFWRARLARALLVGGVALAALRLAPALPRDQHLEFVAPRGTAIRALDLTWSADGTAVGGVQLRPSDPTDRIEHYIRVPHGRYTLEIAARLSTCGRAPCEHSDTSDAPRGSADRTVSFERTLELGGETTRLTLTER